MNWEDTVLNKVQMRDVVIAYLETITPLKTDTRDTPLHEHLRKAQAEISFKAGIREVVEFDKAILEDIIEDGGGNWSIESWKLMLFVEERQAKLKEWGL